ncbi:hypothetical protein HRbin35_00334 [bacterium HR35]|nr:hypothetical protein HRbin35_00334 [bacterium HR35]
MTKFLKREEGGRVEQKKLDEELEKVKKQLIAFIDTVMDGIRKQGYLSAFGMMGEMPIKDFNTIFNEIAGSLDEQTKAILSAYFSEETLNRGRNGFLEKLGQFENKPAQLPGQEEFEEALSTLKKKLLERLH